MTTDYAVRVVTDAQAPDDDDFWDALMEELVDYAPALSEDREGLGAQLAVDGAEDHSDAVARAVAAVLAALGRLGIPGAVVKTEAQTWESFEQDIERPTRPDDLVSTSEAAALLGVVRQRVLQLRDSHEDFPEPVPGAGRTLLWSASALQRFAKTWKRTPGPRAAAQ